MATIKTAVDIDIKVDGQTSVQQAATAYEDLGDAVSKTQKEVERLALSQGLNHPETQQAIQDAARYKEQMEKLDFAIQGARGGTETLFRATQGILGGFEAAAGAAALFGVESEDLERTLVRLQAAMVLSQGLKDFREFLPAIRDLAESIRKQLIPAFNSLRGALIATGWGAAAVAVGYLLVQLDKYIGASKEAAKNQEELNKQIADANKKLAEQRTTVEVLNRIVQDTTINEGKRKEALDELVKLIPSLNEVQLDQADSLTLINNEVEKYIKNADKQIRIDVLRQQAATKLNEQFALQAELEETLSKLRLATGSDFDELKKQFEDLSLKVSEAGGEYDDILDKIADVTNEMQVQEPVVKSLKKEVKETAETFDDFVVKLQAFLKYQDAVSFDKMLRTMSQGLKDMSESAEDTAKSLEHLAGVQIEMPKKAEIQMKTYDKVRAYLYQNQEDIDALGGSISGLFGELGENNKAFALAQVATDTARALSGALANSNSPTPDNIATGGLAGIAKYITLATTILGNAKRARDIIRGGQGATISQSKPSLPNVQAPRTFQASTLGQDFTGQTKVYVTEGDITKTQRRVQNLQRVSVVGG